jgi:hypothetical protein
MQIAGEQKSRHERVLNITLILSVNATEGMAI